MYRVKKRGYVIKPMYPFSLIFVICYTYNTYIRIPINTVIIYLEGRVQEPCGRIPKNRERRGNRGTLPRSNTQSNRRGPLRGNKLLRVRHLTQNLQKTIKKRRNRKHRDSPNRVGRGRDLEFRDVSA